MNTCTISADAIKQFKTLRFRKEKTNAALILKIDVQEMTVLVEEFKEEFTIKDLQEDLPESNPRYLVISYKLNHKDGRVSFPMAGIYYCPAGASTINKMTYASASNVVFQEAGIKVFDLVDPEDFTDEWLVEKIEASKTRP